MDSLRDPRFARDTARDHSRQTRLQRSPAVIITESDAGRSIAYLFVTRPEKGARFIVRQLMHQAGHLHPNGRSAN